MNTGEKIKALRKSLNITQQQLGGEEFTKGYISQIEKGIVQPSMNVLTIISMRLNKPISYLLDEPITDIMNIVTDYAKGKDLYYLQNYQEASDIFRHISTELQEEKVYLYYDSLLYMAKCFSHQQRYEESIDVLNEILNDNKEDKNLELYITAAGHMGYCYSYIGKEDISITYYQKVLWLIKTYNINLPRQKAIALMNLGTSYVNLDKLILSRNYLLEGIDYCKKNKLLSILLDCYIRISRVHLKLDDIQKSKEQLSKAISINDSLDDERVKGDIKSLEVFYYIAEEEYDKAILCLKSSIDISKKYNDDFNFYYNVILLIHCFIEMNQIQEAKCLITEHREPMKHFQFEMISHLLSFEEGIIKLKEGYEKDGMEEMAVAITSLISSNEVWEVYRLSKVYANLIIHQDSNTAKKYYNISMDYFKKLSSMD